MKAPVLARGVEIIDQHSHPHAAIGGAAHMLQQDPRGLVLVNDVVLDIERSLGMIGERDQTIEGLLARDQQPDARQISGRAVLAVRDDAAERGGLRRAQRLARIFLDVLRQADAAGKQAAARRGA